MSVQGITVLGATGSIGLSTLDVMARHPDRYQAVALTANADVQGMLALCRQHQPRYAVMANPSAAEKLNAELKAINADITVLSGEEGLVKVAGLEEVDVVMAAIVGAAGLKPTLEAARQGKRVLLANKEALVMSGSLFMQEVSNNNAVLLPIDSEHNAIFQCMPAGFTAGHSPCGVRRILLTASGGPFRDMPLEKLAHVTPAQACAHPNWDMGRKISVDSATMMNKGLELIEACWLFNVDAEKIQVVVHPQSVVHSMVDYDDGSVLAELGNPDMRTPIAHALSWPERIESGVSALDLFAIARLDFNAPDLERFPCLRLAYEAWEAGGTAPAILNAANEIAVDAFLNHRIPFIGIADIVERTMSSMTFAAADSLTAVFAADEAARELSLEMIANENWRSGT